MPKIYAVKKGRQPGLFGTWEECQKQVNGFHGAIFRGFTDKIAAKKWLDEDEDAHSANLSSNFDYTIYTDGSCLKNPGNGGWAAVIIKNDVQDLSDSMRELSGGEKNTTNNRMELSAAINALREIPKGASAELYTDSQYMKNAFTRNWLKSWKKLNWHKSDGAEVKNRDLWEELDALFQTRNIHFRWVKGHAGDKYNERCDKLARAQASAL